jgi:hypothetical protein
MINISNGNHYIARFLATAHGLALSKAFMDIDDPILRRRVVDLVEEIVSARQSLSCCSRSFP